MCEKGSLMMAYNINLLLLEDDIEVCNNLAYFLKQHFSHIFVANNTYEAHSVFQNNRVDMCIVDIELDGNENGLDFIESLRKKNQKIPILVITGHSDEKYLLRSANANIQGYLLKPITSQKLFQKISAAYSEDTSHSFYANGSSYIYRMDKKVFVFDGKEIALTYLEIEFVELMIQNRYNLVTYDAILSRLYDDFEKTIRNVQKILYRLKKKAPFFEVINHHGVGYMFEGK